MLSSQSSITANSITVNQQSSLITHQANSTADSVCALE